MNENQWPSRGSDKWTSILLAIFVAMMMGNGVSDTVFVMRLPLAITPIAMIGTAVLVFWLHNRATSDTTSRHRGATPPSSRVP